MRDAFATQSGQALRSAVAGHDSELHFGLPQLRRLACQPHRTRQRHFASTAKRKPIDRRDRRFSKCFEALQHALPEQRGFFSAHRSLHCQFGNIRPSHKRFFSRSGENQHAHILIFLRVNQNLFEFFHRRTVQGVQYIRPVKRDEPDAVPLLV